MVISSFKKTSVIIIMFLTLFCLVCIFDDVYADSYDMIDFSEAEIEVNSPAYEDYATSTNYPWFSNGTVSNTDYYSIYGQSDAPASLKRTALKSPSNGIGVSWTSGRAGQIYPKVGNEFQASTFYYNNVSSSTNYSLKNDIVYLEWNMTWWKNINDEKVGVFSERTTRNKLYVNFGNSLSSCAASSSNAVDADAVTTLSAAEIMPDGKLRFMDTDTGRTVNILDDEKNANISLGIAFDLRDAENMYAHLYMGNYVSNERTAEYVTTVKIDNDALKDCTNITRMYVSMWDNTSEYDTLYPDSPLSYTEGDPKPVHTGIQFVLRNYNMLVYHPQLSLLKDECISDEELCRITQNIKTLPTDISGNTIEWSSSNPEVVNCETGKVVRGAKDEIVTLTATLYINGDLSKPLVKTFELTVLQVNNYSEIDLKNSNILCYSPSETLFYNQWNVDDGVHGKLSPPSALLDGVRYGAEYWQKWRSYATLVNINSATRPHLPITFNMELDKEQVISKFEFTEIYKTIGKCEIQVSVDSENWETVAVEEYDDYSTAKVETDHTITFNPVAAKYFRFIITDFQDYSSKIIPEISEFVLYQPCVLDNFEQYISDEPLDAITGNISENLPEVLDNYTISYTSSDNDTINIDTGKVTRGESNKKVTISAEFSLDGHTFIKNYNLTVLANDSRNYIKIYESEDVSVAEGSENTFNISEIETYSLENSFNLKFTVDDLNTDTGVISFENADGGMLFEIQKLSNAISVNIGDQSFQFNTSDCAAASFDIFFDDGTVTVYKGLNNSEYRILCYKQSIPNDSTAVNMVVSALSGNLTISNIGIYLDTDSITDIFNGQVLFSRISDESAFDLTKGLSLFDKWLSIPVKWSSTNENIINSKTGAVNTDNANEIVLLSAKLDDDRLNSSKTFYIPIGINNLLNGCTIASSAAYYGDNTAECITDESFDTSYKTAARKNYSLTLYKDELFNMTHLCIFGDLTQGSITKYTVYAGSDETTLSKVYEGENIGEYSVVNCNAENIKIIRIVVNEAVGISGIKEVLAHYTPDDEQKVINDLNSVEMKKTLSESFPQSVIRANGSAVTFSSNESCVSFEKSNGSWTATVSTPQYSTQVTITIEAELNGITKSKTVLYTISGKHSFNSGGQVSGGSSGGSSYSGSGYITYDSENNEASGTLPNQTAKDFPELVSHWAKSEIEYLIDSKVVIGTGANLNLESDITRAEFLTMIVRGFNIKLIEYDNSFDDVALNDWYCDVVQTALSNGIISGFNNKAAPEDVITREEMSKIIVRTLNMYCGIKIDEIENAQIDNQAASQVQTIFDDDDLISDWARLYVESAANINLIKGYEDNTFKPKNSLHRDEAMVVMYRAIKYAEEMQ